MTRAEYVAFLKRTLADNGTSLPSDPAERERYIESSWQLHLSLLPRYRFFAFVWRNTVGRVLR